MTGPHPRAASNGVGGLYLNFSLLAVVLVGLVAAPSKDVVHAASRLVQGPVTLQIQPKIARGIDAFPRVVSSDAVPPAIAAKINASLQRLDQNVRSAAADCKQQSEETLGRRSVDAWERTVTTTMKGPTFLDIQASDSIYCGGAHPDGETLPMVYDLTTGRPVAWDKLLPAEAETTTDKSTDGTTIGLITWAPLSRMAIAHASVECRDALSEAETLPFALSLDARKGMLVATAYGLPHVIAACAEPLEISPDQAKRLGVSPRITDALAAAKKLQP